MGTNEKFYGNRERIFLEIYNNFKIGKVFQKWKSSVRNRKCDFEVDIFIQNGENSILWDDTAIAKIINNVSDTCKN